MRRLLFKLSLLAATMLILAACVSDDSDSDNTTPLYTEITAGKLTVTGCEAYIGAHPVNPGELLCCSASRSELAPACDIGVSPDIPCVVEFQFCDDGIALKAFSPNPKTNMPGHMVSTNGSWSVNPDTGELTVNTKSESTQLDGMIMEMTETYPNAFTYDDGTKLDLDSLAAISIGADGFGTYRRSISSSTDISGLWTATLDADLTTDATVNSEGYSATSIESMACSPSDSMVCTATPESSETTTSGTHTLPLDLYVTVAGTKMYQSTEAKAVVFEKQANVCIGIADEQACGDHGLCGNSVCQCTHGYIGAECDVPAQCAEDCGDNATCVSGSCVCNTGYAGDDCADINECTAGTDLCENGTCENTDGAYTCDCTTGFAGVYCETCSEDGDRDGYGSPANAATCPNSELDCDDDDPAVYPNAPEVCDGIDNQCPGDGSAGVGSTDEDFGITCTPMVSIPGGTFEMGDAFAEGWPDELPTHSVTLSSFKMDPHEITNAEYAECVSDSSCDAPSSSASYSRSSYYGNATYDNYPVIWLEWQQAKDYCIWAGKRLPTEAEWEYAARGGLEGKRYPWGDTTDDTKANYGLNEGDTVAVESYPANDYGLYDMAGNVWEWVADWWGNTYYSDPDSTSDNPTGPSTGMRRVSRGGSFDHDADGLRNAARCDFCHQDRHGNNLGGRCAR